MKVYISGKISGLDPVEAKKFLNWPIAANLGRRAYGFELKKEFVNAFYERILPYKMENLFIQSEREERKEAQRKLFTA
jgi:DNA modification methylase